MIKETFDFKRILLGKNYDELNPIKNILMAKKDEYYMDQKSDYPKDKWLCRGHIENYLEVKKIFEVVFKDRPKGYTEFDIMNSFWITYKQLLQLSYPMYFCPEGSLSNDLPLALPKPPQKSTKTLKSDFLSYPPFVSGKYEIIHEKYIKYYKENFSDLKVYPGMTWVQFLIDNFDKFSKVHELSELNRYAVLTHTIGNIALVGKGHNPERAEYLYDYWDLYLKKYVKDTLSFNEWKNFVNQQLLNEYVNKDYEILPFWENRKISDFKDESEILPKEEADIIQFLNKVNSYIEKRSERVMNQFNDSKEVI